MIVVNEKCHICGKKADFVIDDKAVLFREAKCSNCGASIRNSDTAGELLNYINEPNSDLISMTEPLARLSILNACSSGYIHDALKNLPEYTCCEYLDGVPSGEYQDGVLCVDLCNIPFPADTFNLVITEDVFEHIVNYEKAMEEILRVLKVGGSHIFTVPVHENKKTESRKCKPPVYHDDPVRPDDGTKVITDWGKDIKDIVEKYGYRVQVKNLHQFYAKEEVSDVDSDYEGYLSAKHLEQYLKYNSVVIIAEKVTETIDVKEKFIQPKSAEVVALNRVIRCKNDEIRALNDDNEMRGKHIIELDQELKAASKRITDLLTFDSTKRDKMVNENLELESKNLNLESENLDLENRNLDLENRILDLEKEKLDLENQNLDLESQNLDLEIKNLKFQNGTVDQLFTGERFIPGIEDNKLEIEHYQRYLSVRNLVRDKVVLDAACGEGYGSNIMASVARSVTGVDIDADTVKRAKRIYCNCHNLQFLQGSIENIPMEDDSVDVVVSFETIEHVSEQIQSKFLGEIVRVLKKDGILVMSTPNKKIYSDLFHYKNEFHVKEFYHNEFLDFLHKKFKNVQLFIQSFQIVSMLNACDRQAGEMAYYTNNQDYVQNGKYYIAVASNVPVNTDAFASVYIDRFGEYEENIQRILTLQAEEESRNQHIEKLNEEIQDAGNRIVELQMEDEKKGQHIQKLDKEISELSQQKDELSQQKDKLNQQNDELSQQKDKLSQQNDELNQKNDELSQQKDKLSQQNDELNQKNDELNQQIEDQKTQIAEMQKTVLNKEGHIELLLEVERKYEHEKTTHAYKLSKKIQRIANWFLPLNSRRRFFARIVFNMFRHPRLMLHVINPKRIRNYLKYIRLEGMEGVKKRYEEAVDLERMMMDPSSHLDVEIENVSSEVKAVNKAVEDYEGIEFPLCEYPVVSIIIPAYNEFDYTYNCLKSILKNSGDIAYEILIANDCSTDVTAEVEKIAKNVRLITTEKNVRFLLNCNHAVQYAKGKYILFLNNDTQVQDNWLQPLIDLIERDEKIGMVGSKLVYPDGYLQEAGGIVWNDASAWNYGNRKSPEDPEYNYVKEVDYISGAAVMIRKALWEEIGGFDERFAPAYCEDSDLAFEVRKHGYKVVYQPLSVVVHFEGVSNGTDIDSGLKSYQVVNQQKFREKWQDALTVQLPNAEKVFIARDRSYQKKVLLMIDHYVPHYDKDAGSRTVFQYLRMFVNKGFHVIFIGDNFYRHEPYTTTLQQMGIEVLYGSYYANNWKVWVKENAEFIDYVFLNRPHISVKYIDYLKDNTRAKIIYYGHDLHFLREMRKYELTKDKKALEDSEDWKQKELELMKKADVIYYPSYVEVREIAKIDAAIKAKAITAYIFENVTSQEYRFEQRKDIMFVGGFVHTPNVDAVMWFTKEILPTILKVLPDITFYIIGSNAPLEIQELADQNVVVKGFVSDEELEQFYENCRISVVPLRYGAGIKGKVIEAMRYGIPVMTTSIGAEGIEAAEQILAIEDDGQLMAEKLVRLYQNETELKRMSAESVAYIQDRFSEDSAWHIIEKDFS